MTHLKRPVFFILPMFALALAAGCSSKKAPRKHRLLRHALSGSGARATGGSAA